MECAFCENAAFEDGTVMCRACLADIEALARLRKWREEAPADRRFEVRCSQDTPTLGAIWWSAELTARGGRVLYHGAETLSAAVEAALKAWGDPRGEVG